MDSKQAGFQLRYGMILYWSEDDQAIIAEVPELPGCMADGKGYQSAIANAELAMEAWLSVAQELNREIPEPKGRLIYA